MVTISVELPKNGMSKARLREITPLMNELYVNGLVPGTNQHRREKRNFRKTLETKKMALRLVKAIPEGVVEVKHGEPTPAGFTELTHGAATTGLGTALRMIKFTDPFCIRLVPDEKVDGVRINDKPASPLQMRGLDCDWQVAFGHKRSQVYMALELSGIQTLGQLALLTVDYLKDNGFTMGMLAEVRKVLREYELDLGMSIEGWPV